MSNFKQINELTKNPGQARTIAQYLSTIPESEWTDWEIDFLEDMARRKDELSTRQAEKLIELRDNALRYAKVSGFVLRSLVGRCWVARQDIDDDDDVEFIERLHSRGETALRKPEALRLKRCAIAIGELEPDVYWAFPSPALRL